MCLTGVKSRDLQWEHLIGEAMSHLHMANNDYKEAQQ